MKYFFLSLIAAVVILLAVVQFFAVPTAEKTIENELKSLGFSQARIEKSIIQPTGLHIKKLILDKDEFSVLEDIRITVFWPTFIFQKNIDSIVIGQASLSSTFEEIYNKTLFQELPIRGLAKIDAQKITLKELVWDVGTAKRAYRINATAFMVKQGDYTALSARLTAEQNTLKFDIQVDGEIHAETSHMEVSVENVDIDLGAIEMNRGSGWLDYKSGPHGEKMLSQLTAGSGKLFDLPLQTLQMTVGHDDNTYPIIFRANPSGLKNTVLAIDTHLAVDIPDQLFHMVLSIHDAPKFRSYLRTYGVTDTNALALFEGESNSLVKLIYTPERRFAGGPYPLSISMTDHQKENSTAGTILLYPDSFDVRGTIEGTQKNLQAIQKMLLLPSDNLSDTSLRVTGNVKDLLQ